MHASRHEMHILVVHCSCILECLWNTIVNEVDPERQRAGERKVRNLPHAARHELHIVGLRRCCILEYL